MIKERGVTSSCHFLFILVMIFLCLGPSFAAANAFVGLWETTYGRVRLIEDNGQISGIYEISGPAKLQGHVQNKILKFKYEEEGNAGIGEFQISPGGQAFTGKWRHSASDSWSPWNGTRVAPEPGISQLILLEGDWDAEKSDYSFGAMLKAFFARNKSVKFHHSQITNKPTLLKQIRETAFLAEPFILVLAGHGSKDGILAADESVGASDITGAMNYSTSAKLIHFSACDIMKGTFTSAIPVSGYKTSVDWAASAIAEFMYFDLILNRNLKPKSAAALLTKLMPFTAESKIENSPFESLGFKFAD